MREIKNGHFGALIFCTFMNMPLTSKNCKKHATVLQNHAKLMANQSMKDAAKELHSKSNAADNDLINCNISCDGT